MDKERASIYPNVYRMNEMRKNSKIYLAGHKGLVGSSLLRKLKLEGYENLVTRSSKELDLRDQQQCEKFFKSERPEYVFLAAAKVGGIYANSSYKAEFIYNNIVIAANVIHSAYKNGVKKLLNLGSSCIYPKFADQPLREDCLLTGPLEPTNEPYAIAKIAAIKLCRYYNEQYGTDFMSVMPTNLYGPNDNFNLETAHILPALIRKFYLAKLLSCDDFNAIRRDIQECPLGFSCDASVKLDDDESVTNVLRELGIAGDCVQLWGTGEPYREFLYVSDLADACVFLMERCSHGDIGECINIGTGNDAKIRDIAEIVKDVVGFEGDIAYDHTKPDGTPRKLLDVSRMDRDIGWVSKTNLEDGIRNTFKWYREKITNIRER